MQPGPGGGPVARAGGFPDYLKPAGFEPGPFKGVFAAPKYGKAATVPLVPSVIRVPLSSFTLSVVTAPLVKRPNSTWITASRSCRPFGNPDGLDVSMVRISGNRKSARP